MHTRRRFTQFGLAGAAALAAPQIAHAADDIVIGYHGPLTGPASWVGLGGRDGSLMAFDEINAAGGVNGRRLRMIVYDDAGKASEAEAVARKMIGGDQVFAILGGGTSNMAIVVSSDAHRGKTLYMNAPAASPKILNLKSRWVFNGATIDIRDIAENDVAFIGQYLKVKKVSVMNGADEFSQTLADTVVREIKERYGIETLTQQKYNPGDTDFSSQLLAVRRSNPEYVLMFGLYVEAARAVRQARELGLKAPIKGDTSMMNSGFLTVAGPAAEGMIVNYVPLYFNGNAAPAMVEFEKRYKARYPSYPSDRPNYVDVYNYGTAYALAEGMRRAGPELTGRNTALALETLNDWQASDNWPGAVDVIQKLSFKDNHAGNRRLSYFQVKGGNFEPITNFVSPVPSTQFPANDTLEW